MGRTDRLQMDAQVAEVVVREAVCSLGFNN